MMRWKTAAAVACLVAVSAVPVFAQDLPSVDEVVERLLDAEGGRERVAAIETRVTRGTISLPAFGISGEFESYVAPPNMATTINFAAVGLMARSGVSDGVAWQIDPTTGSAILTGGDALGLHLQAQIDPLQAWGDYFETAEVIGEKTVGGRPTYEVVFRTEDGIDLQIYFDQESGLVLRQVMVDGARRVTTELDDYGEENGLQVPHTIRAAAPEGEVVLTVLSLEHNVEIPAGTMALPQEIESMRGSN